MNTVDNSQRLAAKVAGIAGILAFALVVFGNYVLLGPLVIPRNAADTARNILAHQTQFRVALICFVTYGIGGIVLLTALYVIFAPVNRGLGLPFFGLAATVCAWLWWKSNYIPKGLSLFGIVSSAWCVFCAFVYLIFPNFNKIINDYIFDSPMALFELVVSFWLLFKGLRPSPVVTMSHHAPNRNI